MGAGNHHIPTSHPIWLQRCRTFPQCLWVIFSRVRFPCTKLASLVSNPMFEIVQSQFRLQWRYAPIDREFVPKKRLFDAKVGMANKMEILIRMPRVGVLTRPSFLFKGSRLPKKFDLQRTPLAQKNKNVAMLVAMSFFPFVLEDLH